MSNNAMQRLSVPKMSSVCSRGCLHRMDHRLETQKSCTNIHKKISENKEYKDNKENKENIYKSINRNNYQNIQNSNHKSQNSNQNSPKNYIRTNNILLKTIQESKDSEKVIKDKPQNFSRFSNYNPKMFDQIQNTRYNNDRYNLKNSYGYAPKSENLLTQSCNLDALRNLNAQKLGGLNQTITQHNNQTFLKKKLMPNTFQDPKSTLNNSITSNNRIFKPPLNPNRKSVSTGNTNNMLFKKELLKNNKYNAHNISASSNFSNSPLITKVSDSSLSFSSKNSKSSDKLTCKNKPSQDKESTHFLNKKQKVEINNHDKDVSMTNIINVQIGQVGQVNQTSQMSDKTQKTLEGIKSRNILVTNQFSLSYDSNPKYDFDHFQSNIKQIDIEKYTSIFEQNKKINEENSSSFTNTEYRCYQDFLIKKTLLPNIVDHLFTEEKSTFNCLSRHKITERMRTRMVDWMIEVLSNYKCEEFTFFLAVNIMDRYLLNSLNCLQPQDLHLIGVTSMFIASKYQDLIPLRLNIVQEKISHGNLTKSEILLKEEDILRKLDYIVTTPSIWDFITIYYEIIFLNRKNYYTIKDSRLKTLLDEEEIFGESQINYNCDNVSNDTYEYYNPSNYYSDIFLNLVKHVLVYLGKMNCHDFKLIEVKPSLIAAGTIYVAMKICEHINSEEYLNAHFKKMLAEISRTSENEIKRCAQIILANAQNFDTNFPDLENLKKIHFSTILKLKTTK